jgi:3D (Asp-Asp-Asp) domain-containing protein
MKTWLVERARMETTSTITKIDNRKLGLATSRDNPYSGPRRFMSTSLRIAGAFALAVFLASCAQQSRLVSSTAVKRLHNVRTTAYTHTEKGCGKRNAVGTYLSGRNVMSAASDWSRFPLGTRFRIVDTKEEFIIDDYGTALVGTNTIDLYKTSRLEMKRWGVRRVDIDILQWGSREQSLKVLGPRKKHSQVRRMIVGLEKKNASAPAVN